MPAGGCIAAFRWRHGGAFLDWLRPAAATGSPAPGETGCFPLVPYSNRIRDGKFSFAGRAYQLARNFAPSPHAIHGHGWQRPWDVAEQGERHVTLTYRHAEDDWPAPYRCAERFELEAGALTVTLSLTNDGGNAMPAGLGLHPYFPRTPECRLTATVGKMWATDAEVMPTALVAPAPGTDPNAGLLPARAALDNCFTGFGGEAVIAWPEHRARLTLSAEAALGHLVIYTPPDQEFFCAEPVSHGTDAVNRDPAGMAVLQPGETFTTQVRFMPQADGAA